MTKIATAAALLLAISSGAALAQGAPPGFTPWHSSWTGNTELQQPMSARQPSKAPAHQFAATKSVPVAGNPQGTRRGG
jgi:hypothetical protein